MTSLIGAIYSETESWDSMICIDSDLRTEATIHWWDSPMKNPRAMLVRLDWKGATAQIIPILLYESDADGEMRIKDIANEDHQELKKYSGFITKNSDNSITGTWTKLNEEKGTCKWLPRVHNTPLKPTSCNSWNEFKSWATNVKGGFGAQLFRGHGSTKFKLSTTLHRQGRSRLERYTRHTLNDFRLNAEAVLGMRFDVNDPDEYGVLLGLAQHHGLPTPLLDWTLSPYIAAFFAFTDALEAEREDVTHVRVYSLTGEFIKRTSPNMVSLPSMLPYISMLSISARHNPRLHAQQGRFMVTNVEEIEDLICYWQGNSSLFLLAADIPVSCGPEALEDLAYMGLTASTLFPGLDGVCKSLKHEMMFKSRLAEPSNDSQMSITQTPVANPD